MNKRMRMFAVGLMCSVLALSGPATAACAVKANVYFINGVNKPSEDDVRDSSVLLGKRLQRYSTPATSVGTVTYLYNDSDGSMLDTLYEMASQKEVERNSIVSEMLVSVGLAAFGMISPLSDADQQAA